MGRFDKLIAALKERRVGFTIEERMQGTHRFLQSFSAGGAEVGQERPFRLHLRWGHPQLTRYLRPGKEFLCARVEGEVSAGGLCESAAVSGTLELRYHVDRSIRYRLSFEAHGQPMRFEGDKRDIRPWNLHRSHTSCHGSVYRGAETEPLSDVWITFDLPQLPSMLRSLRLD